MITTQTPHQVSLPRKISISQESLAIVAVRRKVKGLAQVNCDRTDILLDHPAPRIKPTDRCEDRNKTLDERSEKQKLDDSPILSTLKGETNQPKLC
jgi:hypothetical protein